MSRTCAGMLAVSFSSLSRHMLKSFPRFPSAHAPLKRALQKLTLNNTAIWEREHVRQEKLFNEIYSSAAASTGVADKIRRSRTPWFIMVSDDLERLIKLDHTAYGRQSEHRL
jgi:hypothetical protein